MSGMTDDMLFSIEFVREVERHPCLYNIKHGEYNNKPSVDKAWNKVGERFKPLSVNEIRLKWRSIRSSFSRSHRTNKEYYLAPYLEFLEPFTRTRTRNKSPDSVKMEYDKESDDESCSNGSQSDDGSIEIELPKFEKDSDKDDEFNEFNGKIQVRTLPELKLGLNKEKTKIKGAHSKILVSQHSQHRSKLSPHECYLKSLLPDVSSMNQRQFFNFRRGILKIIGKIKYSKEAPDYES